MGRGFADRAAMAGGVLIVVLVFLVRCDPAYPPPPPFRAWAGLPVSGSLADAGRAGFGDCLSDNIRLRCRRSGVHLLGLGPYEAAVDMAGRDGRAGFDHFTLWVRDDQNAVQAVGKRLRARGWSVCYTGVGNRGDQAIHTRPGVAVQVTVDLSYWMKRRLRIFPQASPNKPVCTRSNQF
ncbi:hypothetical protein [Sphingomonas sp.]|uniref:hypothetical protein n=1 Tax=Sphingomonas sp. TaxID=28214 RepID=UPI0035C7CFB9